MTKYYMPDYSIVTKILSGNTTTTTTTNTSTNTSTTSSTLNETSKWKGKLNRNAKVRTWAGSENKEVSFSPLKKNAQVEVCDTVKDTKNRNWYYIKVGDKYGFIYNKYVDKLTTTTTTTTTTNKTTNKSTTTQYRVQAGAYSVLANANATVATLKKAGYDAVVVKSGNTYIA